MKTIHLFKTYTLIQAATLIASLIFSSSAFAAYSSYLIDLNTRKVTDLGSLGGGNTVARAINDAGQVVGESTTVAGVYRAFITGPDGMGMVDLEAPGSSNIATGINATDRWWDIPIIRVLLSPDPMARMRRIWVLILI